MCGFSNMACRILDAYEVEYGSRDVLADPDVREGVKAFTHWPTIPQIFIGGEFVGGSDILMQMHQSGELQKQLEKLAANKK
jgi:monothiol glutaredoxin